MWYFVVAFLWRRGACWSVRFGKRRETETEVERRRLFSCSSLSTVFCRSTDKWPCGLLLEGTGRREGRQQVKQSNVVQNKAACSFWF